MNKKFEIQLLEEVDEFLANLDGKARKKIIYNLRKAQMVSDDTLFKKLNHNIWEFRTFYKRTKYRLFAFWDKTNKNKTLVISTHGIEKKTSKTPKKEIIKAERIMIAYFNSKK